MRRRPGLKPRWNRIVLSLAAPPQAVPNDRSLNRNMPAEGLWFVILELLAAEVNGHLVPAVAVSRRIVNVSLAFTARLPTSPSVTVKPLGTMSAPTWQPCDAELPGHAT